MSTTEQEKAAAVFCDAIKTIAGKPENLNNLQHYLERHFDAWMKKYASDPLNMAAEM